MKKLLLLTALFIFACSSDDSSDTNDNNVPDGQYFFEIEIGNEVHRIQGINTEIITNGQNWCSASLLQGTQGLIFRLSDTSASDYVSGQPLQIMFYINNPQLGSNNNGRIEFLDAVNQGSFLYNYAEQNNFNFLGSSFVENTPMNAIDAISEGVVGKISNITLSSIGTSPSNPILFDGDNLSGSYEGVLYFIANGSTNSDTNHDIPVPIKISFSAVRFN
jgi:hypothetical protein